MIPDRYLALIEPLTGIRTMLELGNKRGTGGPGDTYKAAFTARGIAHTSVDLNGLDGALPLDLRKALDLGRFDMVTNVGTSEHVSDQKPVWRNMIDACDHVLVSITPRPGDWPGHGLFYPTADFYRQLAQFNGFHIEKLVDFGDTGRGFVGCRMRRFDDFGHVRIPDQGLIPAPPRLAKPKRA